MKKLERTTGCGLVAEAFKGKKISLCGWVNKRRDHGGLIFVDLRDRSGVMQLVFNPEISNDAHKKAESLRSEFVVSVTGMVVDRSKENINPDMSTGALELKVDEVDILSSAETLPFILDEAEGVEEELRLRYRYLDLRRKGPREKLVMRNKIIFAMREFFMKEEFYEVETPILTKNTPEGSREFLVPSRIHHGYVYAMPQSPQLYKQLLMAAGFEKYFQVARCFRDEDLRADRQPEFTQLDVEMSFVDEEDIISVIEGLLHYTLKTACNVDVTVPFPRMLYKDAFGLYGSDKPDTRFDMTIKDFTSTFKNTELRFLQDTLKNDGKIGGFVLRDSGVTRAGIAKWENVAKGFGAKGLLWARVLEAGKLESPVSKFLPDNFIEQIEKIENKALSCGDIAFFIAGKYEKTWDQLGRLRLEVAKALNMIPKDKMNFLWVTEFPLFEYDENTKGWESVNHPFTSPQDGWENMDVSDIKSKSYDVILNGVELGGGSIRIHDADVQKKVFDLLGLDKKQMNERFGFLLEAQKYGFPPHGGIALGLDRVVMLLTGSESLREVVAFPKTQRGYDPMMNAPTHVDKELLKEYGLSLVKGKEKK